VIRLRRTGADHDPSDRLAALTLLERARAAGEFITGLLYLSEARPTLAETLGVTGLPLAELSEAQLRPPPAALEALNAEYR
jgi:2-oxoglutarate ferredoxin oxidoreductase subunit beta